MGKEASPMKKRGIIVGSYVGRKGKSTGLYKMKEPFSKI